MATLDFGTLTTPPHHGEVLLVPQPKGMARAARENHEALRRVDVPLLNTTLAECRRRTREALVGTDDTFIIVTGHQPAFIHPGVWAKHVVATRLAAALGGVVVNLVVDSDTPQRAILDVPCLSGDELTLRPVPFASWRARQTYEQIARPTPDEAQHFERAVRVAMGERFEGSQMPAFFGGFCDASTGARDWVDQTIAGRRAIEVNLGITVNDHRVSRLGWNALWSDLLVHVEDFAVCYNHALGDYRRAHRIRGVQRPIPDLQVGDDRCETVFWVYRGKESRRRLFVRRERGATHLETDGEGILSLSSRIDDVQDCLENMEGEPTGWCLRPRALALTLWARLLLADVFIHGIGGAKYDRITDAIIAAYYDIEPPAMACVSATLHMDLPQAGVTPESVRRLRRDWRDLAYNPQRHVPTDAELQELLGRRADMVRRSTDLRRRDPRNRAARHAIFLEIRRLNEAILARRPDIVAARGKELAQAEAGCRHNRIAWGREYFFGLHDRARLEQLLRALPAEHDFRV